MEFHLRRFHLKGFHPNITPVNVIKRGASGGIYFRDIYSNVNNKWYKHSWNGIQRIQRI